MCAASIADPPTGTFLATVPSNTTVLQGSIMSFNCSTNANPPAHVYHFYLNQAPIGNSSTGVFSDTVEEDGVYTCVPINTVPGTGDNDTVSVTTVGELQM